MRSFIQHVFHIMAKVFISLPRVLLYGHLPSFCNYIHVLTTCYYCPSLSQVNQKTFAMQQSSSSSSFSCSGSCRKRGVFCLLKLLSHVLNGTHAQKPSLRNICLLWLYVQKAYIHYSAKNSVPNPCGALRISILLLLRTLILLLLLPVCTKSCKRLVKIFFLGKYRILVFLSRFNVQRK